MTATGLSHASPYGGDLQIFVADRALFEATPTEELNDLPYETFTFSLTDLQEIGWRFVYDSPAEPM